MLKFPSYPDVQRAAERIAPFIHKTPVLSSATFNRMFHSDIFFKCENFQKVGAFKFRGACNAVFSMKDDELKKGVATHSSGNFAQALSLSAALKNIPAHIVMPETAPGAKIAAVRGYGGNVIFCKPTQAAREEKLREVVKDTGAISIHPFNDEKVIAGQGTVAMEFLQKATSPDFLLAPVGGGGLISGTAIAAKAISPRTTVIGVEPKGADDAFRSFQSGKIVPSVNPNTIADGLLTSLGTLTFALIQKFVDEIVTVEEASIIQAMRLIWERMKIVVEPSAAVPFAAILESKIPAAGKKVGIILSGGNVDLNKLPWL